MYYYNTIMNIRKDSSKDIQVSFPKIVETKNLPKNILKFLEDKNIQNDEE